MSVVIPPGFGLAAFTLTGPNGTQPFVTTIGLDLSAAGGDFVEAANSAFAAYAEAIMPDTSDALTLERVVLTVGQDGPGGSVDSTLPAVQGNNAGSIAPLAMSVIGRKTTAMLGRGSRGRMFLPGSVDEAGVDEGGYLTTAVQDGWSVNLQGFASLLREATTTPSTIALPPVLLHSTPTTPTPIEGISCAPQVGWIRKRIR